MMVKALAVLLAATTTVCALAACGQSSATKDSAETSTKAAKTVAESTKDAEKTTEPEVKVLQDRVIEITYDTFDYEEGAAYLNKYDTQMGGCSAVKLTVDNKVYVGRDYDFYCSDSPAFVVRNNSGEFKTIGIGNSPSSFDAWTEDYQVKPEVLKAVPFLCCDVMSEAGLYCETNIRPFEEELSCTSTNPGKERLCTQAFMQTMLSQYGTIDEVLEHLDDYDWFDLSKMGFEQSFFLTDQSGRSVIIEFAANECRWQECDHNANFFINDEWYEKETLGCGEMRLEKEYSYLPYVRTEDDIFTMMKRGAYDQFYHEDCDIDMAIPEMYELTGLNKTTAAKDMDAARAATKEQIEKLSKYTWEDRIENKSWESTFITAANVTDLTLNVHFSEHYNINFTVAFE